MARSWRTLTAMATLTQCVSSSSATMTSCCFSTPCSTGSRTQRPGSSSMGSSTSIRTPGTCHSPTRGLHSGGPEQRRSAGRRAVATTTSTGSSIRVSATLAGWQPSSSVRTATRSIGGAGGRSRRKPAYAPTGTLGWACLSNRSRIRRHPRLQRCGPVSVVIWLRAVSRRGGSPAVGPEGEAGDGEKATAQAARSPQVSGVGEVPAPARGRRRWVAGVNTRSVVSVAPSSAASGSRWRLGTRCHWTGSPDDEDTMPDQLPSPASAVACAPHRP